jgi:catechol 2,3-dioxygenase
MLEALNAPAHVAGLTLAVADLDGVAAFYGAALGLVRRDPHHGEAALCAADGTELMRLTRRPDLPAREPATPGLFHAAFLMPSRADLARWLRHAGRLGLRLEGASDHLVSEAVYLSDPEGNGIEIYADRPRAAWAKDGDGVAMATMPLDGPSLLAEAPDTAAPFLFPAGGRIGHVHLQVADQAAAEAYYVGALGMAVMARYPGASFLSWGGYHHHIAVNVWRSRGIAPAGPQRGLAEIRLAGALPEGPWRDPSGNILVAMA